MKTNSKSKKPVIATSIKEKPRKDEEREERIMMEIIVDAFTPEE